MSRVGAGVAAIAAVITACTVHAAPGGYVPAELVGKWQAGSQTDVNFGDGSGSFSGPTGVILQWQFTADGHYTFDDYDSSSMYACTTAVLGHETGSVDFDASSFTATATDATIISQDNCHAEYNYRKAWSTELAGPRQYQFSYDGSTLVVADGSGQTVSYALVRQ